MPAGRHPRGRRRATAAAVAALLGQAVRPGDAGVAEEKGLARLQGTLREAGAACGAEARRVEAQKATARGQAPAVQLRVDLAVGTSDGGFYSVVVFGFFGAIL